MYSLIIFPSPFNDSFNSWSYDTMAAKAVKRQQPVDPNVK